VLEFHRHGRRLSAAPELRPGVFAFEKTKSPYRSAGCATCGAPEDEGTTTSREIRGMTETPWRSYFRAAPERDYVALLSYLPLNSAWSLPRLVVYSTRIQRQLRTSSGLIGYSLRARLASKQFWTLSAWEDAAILQAFVAARPHVAVMKAMAPHMGATRFVRWNVKGSELPLRWDVALSRGY
jgi:hypothetical protein